MSNMKTPRQVAHFPHRGNHVGDLIQLPSGQIYEWIGGRREGFQRWSRVYHMKGQDQ
jgi:hypothetical protein